MFWILIVALILICPSIIRHHEATAKLNSKPKIDEILTFLSKNGKRHVCAVTLDNHDRKIENFQNQFLEISKTNNIFTRKINTNDAGIDAVPSIIEKLDFYKDSVMIFASATNTSNLHLYFELLSKVESMSTTLILCDPIDVEKRNFFISKLKDSSKNRFFYWLYENSNEIGRISYNRVVTVLNVEQVVVNKLNFNSFGIIIEDYDLQGMHIQSTTVSWPPYIFLSEECKDPTLYNACKAYGHLVDALNVMGKMSNFTWECHGNRNDDYGTTPLSGPANASGTWGGVVGDVFYGKYQFSMSTWVWKEERQDMFDFASIVTDQSALAITLKAKEIDYTLFTRPFTFEAWLLIGLAVLIFMVATIFPYLFAPNFGESNSYRMVIAITFLFFMLTEIYYSGALTMFFSTAPKMPFETIEEVMRKYPDWKLMMRYGNDVYYINKVQEGDPDYVAFWDRVINEPDESVFKSVGEGMNEVLNGFYVAQMQEGSIKGWIRDNPIDGEKVQIFGRGRASYYTLILTNNSPLTPIFSSLTRTMIEKGAIDRINAKWIERKKSADVANLESTLIVLKPGQMILMYFLVLLMILLTLSVFILEHIWKSSGGDRLKTGIENRMKESEYLNLG